MWKAFYIFQKRKEVKSEKAFTIIATIIEICLSIYIFLCSHCNKSVIIFLIDTFRLSVIVLVYRVFDTNLGLIVDGFFYYSSLFNKTYTKSSIIVAKNVFIRFKVHFSSSSHSSLWKSINKPLFNDRFYFCYGIFRIVFVSI